MNLRYALVSEPANEHGVVCILGSFFDLWVKIRGVIEASCCCCDHSLGWTGLGRQACMHGIAYLTLYLER